MQLLPFRNHFGFWKHQRYFACCFFVPKDVVSTISRHFNLEFINHTYIVEIYTLKTPSTPSFFVYNR